MNILIIARGVPTDKTPQDGVFEFDQARALKKAGHNVVVMAVETRIKLQWRKIGITEGIKDEIPTYRIFCFPTSVIRRISYRISSWIENKLALLCYRHVVGRHGLFDVVHAHYLPCSSHGVAIKDKYGINLVATEHWSELNKTPLASYVKYLGDRTYNKLDKLITVCNPLKDRIASLFNVDSVVVHNMVDRMFEEDYIPERHEVKEKFRFIMVGSIIYGKGIDVLIKAFDKSKLKEKGVTVKVIGTFFPYVNTLRTLIEEYDLRDSFEIHPALPKQQIYDELKKADSFVLPSRSENFSVAVLEALAAGLPVIATQTGGILECIDDSNGIVVPVEDIDALAEAMVTMYENIGSYDRQQIRNNCLGKFSASAIAGLLEKEYMSMI